MSFKAGDEVQHKSGGPKMIVEGRQGDLNEGFIGQAQAEWVVCSWMDKTGKVQRDAFPPEALESYKANAPFLGTV